LIQSGLSPSIGVSSGQTESSELVSDKLGLRKMLLLSTEVGKLFGVDSENGNIIWSLSNFIGLKEGSVVLLRSPASYAAIALFIAQTPEKKTLFAYFNPITGEIQEGSPFIRDYEVDHVIRLPQVGQHHTHFVFVVDSKLNVRVFPENDVENLILSDPVSFFLWNETSLKGYQIHAAKPGQFLTTMAWSLPFSEGEKIVALSQKSPLEKVASLGRVLGDRRVLYKYLNPALIAVATITSSSTLNIYLIDSHVGGVIGHQFHHQSASPVSLVVCEHWVVYHYWNKREKQYQLSVLELFESVQPDVRVNKVNFTSYDGFIPEILAQSYIFPAGVSALAVSQTKRGITSRQILFGLTTDQIYGIGKRMVDPRRKLGAPSNEDREEGLIPYDPFLPVNPKGMVSYNQTVARVRNIVTFPANLESTSLILAYGLDMFFTRTNPSKTFDSLTDEFEYGLLLLTIALLVVALVVSSRLANRKALRAKWK